MSYNQVSCPLHSLQDFCFPPQLTLTSSWLEVRAIEKSKPKVREFDDSGDEGVAKLSMAEGVRAAISEADANDRSPKIGVSSVIRRRALFSSRRIGNSFKLMESRVEGFVVSGEEGFKEVPEGGDGALGISTTSGRRRRIEQARAS